VRARLEEWLYETLQAGTVELLAAAALDHVCPHAGGDAPDVLHGDHGELTSPADSQRDAAEQGDEFVAAAFAAVEAPVGVLPHAVDGVGTFGFCQHIFEGYLQMVVDVIRITVYEINFRHLGW